MHPLSFSTCWNGTKPGDGEEIVDEIRELGFDTIEISHGTSVSKQPGLQRAFQEGKMRVSGVHNYFPSPVDVMIDAPDCFEFTSHRGAERQRALDLTRRTLENAAEFQASYVVLHLGSVPMPAQTPNLTSLVKAGELNSPAYVQLKIQTIRQREKLAPLYLRRARAALEKIAVWAEEFRVPVGVESRSRYEDIPSEREMREIMMDFRDCPWVGYWHDFGHVQLKHNLALLDHQDWLASMQPYLLGCHLHDVQWPARDHRVPLTGSIDYDALLPYVAPTRYLVWELGPNRRAETIRARLAEWRHRYGGY
ncbi:MAG TPA: TIM barrel protein [Verrucomicrobiales bacterium]|nr:TIM barrel protein [Verrucomicrobiales bacterium]